MSAELARSQNAAPDSAEELARVVESLVVRGDISALGTADRARYYMRVCEGLGLNPHAQPLAFLKLNGKEVLYVTRGATDQLAAMHRLNRRMVDGPKVIDLGGTKVVYAVCEATHPNGRTETAIATLPFTDPVNVFMKAETKAKRRATLSILGLGMLDEMELETIPAGAMSPASQPVLDPGQSDGGHGDGGAWHERPPARDPVVIPGMVDAIDAIRVSSLCVDVVDAYRRAHDVIRAAVSLDSDGARGPLDTVKAEALEALRGLGLPLTPSKATMLLVSEDLAAIADDILALAAQGRRETIPAWWLAHREAIDAGLREVAEAVAVRVWRGCVSDSTIAVVKAAGAEWRKALAAPVAPQPQEPHPLVVALREHLASKPAMDASDPKAHTTELAEVCASYHKRARALRDAGELVEPDGLAVVRAELHRRGCLEPDALLAAVAGRKGRVAK